MNTEIMQTPTIGAQEFFFTARGRTGRLDYFLGTLCSTAVVLAAFLFLNYITGDRQPRAPDFALIAFMFITHFCICMMLLVKRLHDLGRSGWTLLIMFVPIVNMFFSLYVYFARGQQNDNAYGPMPRRFFRLFN